MTMSSPMIPMSHHQSLLSMWSPRSIILGEHQDAHGPLLSVMMNYD
jgi:hypothetical protein